jgi:anaerobic nitric oxide reductase flavorubredoxin
VGKVSLAKGLYWVGAIDWNIRSFHGYITPRGTTYNAYLIVDEKTALVDTVKAPFFNEMLERIGEIVKPEEINYVISNHVEIDHSGSLPMTMKLVKNAELIATEKGKSGLTKYYKTNWRFATTKERNELDLGKRKLKFIETPMLHWPDSMVTYVEGDNILLSSDAFGQHLATSQRFDDQVDMDIIMQEATKYYANIVMPFGTVVQNVLGKLQNLKINVIAPAHGVIWRTNPKRIVDTYGKWARGESKNKILIVYDSMWGSTEIIAKALLDAISSEDVEVDWFNLSKTDDSEVMTQVLDAKVLLVGSPTLNNGMFPTVSRFLTYLKGLRPKGKIGACFGSYGWGGGAVKAMEEEMRRTGIEVVESNLGFRYVPDEEELRKAKEFGKMIAQRIKQS